MEKSADAPSVVPKIRQLASKDRCVCVCVWLVYCSLWLAGGEGGEVCSMIVHFLDAKKQKCLCVLLCMLDAFLCFKKHPSIQNKPRSHKC